MKIARATGIFTIVAAVTGACDSNARATGKAVVLTASSIQEPQAQPQLPPGQNQASRAKELPSSSGSAESLTQAGLRALCEGSDHLRDPDAATRYVGLEGYVVVEPNDVYNMLPKPPWNVNALKRVTRDVFKPSSAKVEHKTKVRVLETNIRHTGHGFYSGQLRVAELEKAKREFWIELKSFTLKPYWTCGITAIPFGGYVLARVTQEMTGPNRQGSDSITVKPNELVLCTADQRDVEGDALCLVYRKYRYGFGGVEHGLRSVGLEFVY